MNLQKFQNSLDGFSKYIRSKTGNNVTIENFDNENIDKALEELPLLNNIVNFPIEEGLKYFIDYKDNDRLKEIHKEEKIKEELLRVAREIRKYGNLLVVYNDLRDLDTTPNANFKNFLTFNSDNYQIDELGNISISVERINNDSIEEITYILPKELENKRYILFNQNSVVRDLYFSVSDYNDSLTIPVSLMRRNQVDIMKLEGLAEALSSCESEKECEKLYEKLYKKLQTVYLMMDNFSLAPIDKNEEFEQLLKDIKSYKDIQEALMIEISALSRIPMTILFGKSPEGFNSGESELESYYNFVNSNIQERLFTPLLNLYHRNKRIKFDITYNPIKQLNKKELAEKRFKESQTILNKVNAIATLESILEAKIDDKAIINFIFNDKDIKESDLIDFNSGIEE